MSIEKDALAKCIESIPPSDQIRAELAENAERGKLLLKMLRLATQRERLREVEVEQEASRDE